MVQGVFSFSRLADIPVESTPHAVQLAMQDLVIQLARATPGQYHDIDGRQIMLCQANGFSDKPLETITINGKANVSLAEYETQTGMPQGVGRGQCHQPLAMNLVDSGIEDSPIIPGGQ
jgi:hypothetical protein